MPDRLLCRSPTVQRERVLLTVHRRQAGTWDEGRQTRVDTICGYCGVGCTLRLHVQDNEIVKVTSPLEHSVTRGNLCIKGRFGWRYVQD